MGQFHFEGSQTKLPIPKPTSSWKMWLRKIPRTTQGMKEKQSGTSFDSNHISLVITVRIKLQTLITGLSTKVFRITARTSFRNGSAAQARDRIHGTVCMTSQLAVNFNSSQIFVACSHIYIYI